MHSYKIRMSGLTSVLILELSFKRSSTMFGIPICSNFILHRIWIKNNIDNIHIELDIPS